VLVLIVLTERVKEKKKTTRTRKERKSRLNYAMSDVGGLPELMTSFDSR